MTTVTDVKYRTSRPRISASGWLFLPCAVVRLKFRNGQPVDALVITVDGSTEDRACEIANDLIFELTRAGCVELDRDDQTLHRLGRRSSFTLTVSPAGLALKTLVDEGYHVSRGDESGPTDHHQVRPASAAGESSAFHSPAA